MSRCFQIFLRVIPLLLATLSIGGCISAPEIRVNSDKNADFSAYHSYGFVDSPGTDRAGYTTLVTQYLKSAVSHELENRGYVYSDEPDLLVNFYTRLEDRNFITSSPSPVYFGGYYEYRHGVYAAYPYYINQTYSYSFKEGTVNVDLIDAQQKQMIWEGIAVNEVSKQDLENPQKAFEDVISAIFSQYPYQAGSAVPVVDQK